jgi:hypothetical protein
MRLLLFVIASLARDAAISTKNRHCESQRDVAISTLAIIILPSEPPFVNKYLHVAAVYSMIIV